MKLHKKSSSASLLCVALLTGCALFGGGGNDLVRAKGYTVTPPNSWTSQDRGESDKAFTLPSRNIVTVTSSCNRDTSIATELLTKQLLIGARNVEFVEKRKISVDGADGLFSRVKATYDGVRSYLLLFVIPKDDCVFDFSLISNRLIPDGDVDGFLNFVRTFKYGKG